MARLSILLLGTLKLTIDGAPLSDFRSLKARALLAYVAQEADRSHRRESLAGLLWPEVPERRARHSLSQALSRIRRALAANGICTECVLASQETVQFLPDGDCWVDARQLLSAEPSAQAVPAQHNLEALAAAVALYRGPFLDGLSLADCVRFEEWIVLQREQLERAVGRLLDALSQGYARRYDYDRALTYAWRHLDLDPWREDVHRQVMWLLAQSGQRGAALRQYDACCRILADELGVDPEPATTDLYDCIARGTASARDRRESVGVHFAVPDQTLPAPLYPLIGREEELLTALARLAAPECRILTLVGPGGIGKTRLALEIAHKQTGRFPDGVHYVSLAALQRSEALTASIAQAVGLTLVANGGPTVQQLRTFLRSRSLLLVLDSAEHLVARPGQDGMASLVAELLTVAAGVTVLVTSRVRLGLLGEHVLPVGPLSSHGAREHPASALDRSAASSLFVQAAQRVLPSFLLTEGNSGTVDRICRCVEGHPLALLMAASWVSTLQLSDIARSLDSGRSDSEGLDLLEAGWRNVPDGHRSMRAVFARSWSLLEPRAQRILAGLAVFPGGFTRDAAHSVADASSWDLRALTDASLLAGATSGRYRMHALIQRCALEKLDLDPVAGRRTKELLCRYCLPYAERLAVAEGTPEMPAALDAMGVEIDNVRAAWDWAAAKADVVFLDRAVRGLSLFYAHRARDGEGVEACAAAERALEGALSRPDAEHAQTIMVLSKVLRHRCWFVRQLDEQTREATARRALKLLDDPRLSELDTRAERADALLMLGRAVSAGGQREQARELYSRSAHLYEQLGRDGDRAAVLVEAAWNAWCAGEFARSRRLTQQGRNLARRAGALQVEAQATVRLSGVAAAAGDLPEAARFSEEVLAIQRRLGQPGGIASALYSLGLKRAMLCQLPEAETLLKEALRINRDQLGLTTAYEEAALAMTWMYQGRYTEALQTLRGIETGAPRYGNRLQGWTQLLVGSTLLAQERFDEAERALCTSIRAYRPIKMCLELSSALALLGVALCMQGRSADARNALLEAVQFYERTAARLMLPNVLLGFALLSALESGVVRAIELAAVVQGLPFHKRTPWSADAIYQHLDAAIAEAGLTDEEVTAAQAGGRAMQVDKVIDGLLGEGQAATP